MPNCNRRFTVSILLATTGSERLPSPGLQGERRATGHDDPAPGFQVDQTLDEEGSVLQVLDLFDQQHSLRREDVTQSVEGLGRRRTQLADPGLLGREQEERLATP